jgi:TusE/DsrC/DsvC family sulfur relay protein
MSANHADKVGAEALEAKIDALQAQVALLVEHQRRQQELIEELMPISREVMGALSDQLSELEQKGYFSFGRAGLRVMDKVVTSYGEGDVEALGDNIVAILDTVRSVTRPEVLQFAQEASEAIREADQAEDLSPWGAFRKASNDKDVRHGVAVMVSVLKHLGRATRRMSHQEKLKPIAPRRLAAPASAPAPAPARAVKAAPVAAPSPVVAPVEELMIAWSRDWAAAQAAQLGVGPLGEVHWKLIGFARDEYQKSGGSPNVRRISQGSGVSVKELYGAFPQSPGVLIARLAGIPKPKGCI